MEAFNNRPTSRILGDIHALLMASNVKVRSSGQTLSFRGLVGETRITVSPSGLRTLDGLGICETICIESVAAMEVPREMECLLNMQASIGALVLEDDGKFRIKSRFSLHSGDNEDVIRGYAGVLFFVAKTHTDALQAAMVDALRLPIDKAPRLDGGGDGRWDPASFSRTAAVLNESGAFANGDPTGLTAEFPWDPGAFSTGLDSPLAGPTKRTSLLQIERAEHPNVGKGLFCRLDLPLQLTDSEAFTIATNLNRVESTADDWPPFLGAWTSKPGSGRPTFVSFWSDSFAQMIDVDTIAKWMSDRARRMTPGNDGPMTDTDNYLLHRSSNQGNGDAVTAAHLRPLDRSAMEVGRSFGSPPTSNVTVHSGISAIYHEACRQAAAERGVQPRQMQSVTWEARRHISPETQKRVGVKDSREPKVEHKGEIPVRKSAIREALDGSKNRIVTKEKYEKAKAQLRGNTAVPVSRPPVKNYIYTVLGMIAFFSAMSFTQAGTVLLHGGIAARELLADAIVSSFKDVISWAFWVAIGAYFWFSTASAALFDRLLKHEGLPGSLFTYLGCGKLFLLPVAALSFLALVLWGLAATLVGAPVTLLPVSFSIIAKAAGITFGLYLLLAGLGTTVLGFLNYTGFQLAVTGTLISAQLSIPELLVGQRNHSPAGALYPSFLILSLCWAFAAFVSWLGKLVSNRLFRAHKLSETLFTEAIGAIGGFIPLCFVVEYARLVSA